MFGLVLSSLACTSGRRADLTSQAGAGAGAAAGTGAGSAAGLDPSAAAGSAGTTGEPAGGNGGAQSTSGSAATDSAVVSVGTDSGARPTDGGLDAAPPGALDASNTSPDASVLRGDQPGCPFVLPEVYGTCSGEGLMCEYGMECCPDFAYCELGQWTLLTHHCDACI
jgi:hypothetical protein